MLFPQFTLLHNKSSFNYVDINNIILTNIYLKETWNEATFKQTTQKTWSMFKDKLSNDQKIVMRKAIIDIRKEVRNKMSEERTVWLSSRIVSTLFLSSVSPSILTFYKRQSTIKNHLDSLSL